MDIRLCLQDVPTEVLNRELRAMDLTPRVTLAPESNQKALTPAERDAAVVIGEQEKHLLSIAP